MLAFPANSRDSLRQSGRSAETDPEQWPMIRPLHDVRSIARDAIVGRGMTCNRGVVWRPCC